MALPVFLFLYKDIESTLFQMDMGYYLFQETISTEYFISDSAIESKT